MSLGLAVQANYPVISPNTVVAQVVTPTSGNYTAGGEPCSLVASGFTDPNQSGLIGPNSFLPVDVSVEMENGQGYNGYWIPGTTLANGKLQLFAPSSDTEFSGSWATWNAL